MAIGNRDLKVGTKLVARYRKNTYRAEVVAGEEGRVAYRMEDGRVFKSPSAAGSAVMDGKACNGWAFWSVEGETKAKPAEGGLTLAEPAKTGETGAGDTQSATDSPTTATGASEPATTPMEPTTAPGAPTDATTAAEETAHPAPKPKGKAKGRPKGGKGSITLADNQNAVPEGQARYFCKPCDGFFLGSANETPRTCLAGHRAS